MPLKTIFFILSIYVAVLSTIPCCTDDNCNDEIKTEQIDNNSEDHQEKECNSCSPFFTCGDCSGFVRTNINFDLAEAIFIINKLVSNYKSQFINSFIVRIWQPPKLS
ncbi:DUF6660 family protein [Flavobacterium sp. GNP001]